MYTNSYFAIEIGSFACRIRTRNQSTAAESPRARTTAGQTATSAPSASKTTAAPRHAVSHTHQAILPNGQIQRQSLNTKNINNWTTLCHKPIN